MKSPIFICKKCGHHLFLISGNLKKLLKGSCPSCGEEPEELWGMCCVCVGTGFINPSKSKK